MKCKCKAGFHVNVHLDPKSIVRVVICHSMHSDPELTLIIRTKLHSMYIIPKYKDVQQYCPKPRASQVSSFEGQFCQSFNT